MPAPQMKTTITRMRMRKATRKKMRTTATRSKNHSLQRVHRLLRRMLMLRWVTNS